ncbi:MAG: hypothetical protein ICV64_07805 [Thermoleophilia bacterium]|nr:hypothetical protein [Thermoleophilia bacterium]
MTDGVGVDAAQLAADEAAAHAAMRDARAELHRLDMQIESQPRDGLAKKFGSAFSRRRRGSG